MDNNIKRAKRVLEAAGYQSSKDYSEYTESMLDDELDTIEETIREIANDLTYISDDEDAHDDLIYDLEDLSSKLYDMEDYLNDEQLERQDDLLSNIRIAKETPYEGSKKYDPYRDRGLRQSDFQ